MQKTLYESFGKRYLILTEEIPCFKFKYLFTIQKIRNTLKIFKVHYALSNLHFLTKFYKLKLDHNSNIYEN
jgi:hypothetical protein